MAGYRSKIDLGLGQMPEIKDNPQVFNELQSVYNAIHLLNARLDRLSEVEDSPCNPGPDIPPNESLTFECNSFWSRGASNVRPGDLVRFVNGRWWKGIKIASITKDAPYRCGTSTSSARTHIHYCAKHTVTTGLFGVCLARAEDAAKYPGLVHVGLPPAAIEMGGTTIGQTIYTYRNDGKLYYGEPQDGYYPVGECIKNGVVLLQYGMTRTYTARSHTETIRDGGGG